MLRLFPYRRRSPAPRILPMTPPGLLERLARFLRGLR